jgi:putative membrane protein insertion efficiency factor
VSSRAAFPPAFPRDTVEFAEHPEGRPGQPPDSSASPRRPRRIARAVVTAPILFYSRVISPALPRRCKYEPTCSRYALDAVREYGIIKGLVLAGWRLLRCNPWSHGGFDPVVDQRVFRTRSERHA